MWKHRNDITLIGDQFHVTTSFLVQTLTWLPECLNEKKDKSHLVVGKYPYIFFNYYKTHTHISFSIILAGILRAGKNHFLGNLAGLFAKCALLS